MGDGSSSRILRTYHADAFNGIRAAGIIGGVGPVVRVPGNIGSVLVKCCFVIDLYVWKSSKAGFISFWGETRDRS